MDTEESSNPVAPTPILPPKRAVSAVEKYLFLVVFLGGLLALFYAEENWRGRRAWEKVRAELLAKGEPLDWKKALETPPPDDQNLWKAPGIGPEFVNGFSPKAAQATPLTEPDDRTAMPDVALGEIEFIAPDSPKAAGALRFDDLSKSSLARETFYRAFVGRSFRTPDAVFQLTENPPSHAHLLIVADPVPTPQAMSEALTKTKLPPERRALKFTQIGARKLAVLHDAEGWRTADEFLNRPDDRLELLHTVHEAAKRPRAWIPGNYEMPFEIPHANFVRIRTLAQYAGSRAEACILLRHGSEALTNIAYIFDLGRLLENKPVTLVNAMINTAIHGLALGIIEEGFADDVWSGADLRRLQELAARCDVLAPVVDSLRTGERIGVTHLLVTTPVPQLLKILKMSDEKPSWRDKAKRLIPRGWFFQNAANYGRLMQSALDAVETSPPRVHPDALEAWTQFLDARAAEAAPFWSVAVVATPRVEKALQTAAKYQTFARCVSTATALELYRREHKEYPAKLDDLVPQYLASVPQDLIAKGSLRYRRVGSQYVLYSPGWDRRDGVEPTLAKLGGDSFDLWTLYSPALRDDWVWTGVPSARQVQSLTASNAK